MILKNIKIFIKQDRFLSLLFALFLYAFYFYPQLFGGKIIYFGDDTTAFHFPSKFYLHEKLSSGQFPLWSERIYGGFPIYTSLERNFLNPLNILFVYIFGPINSFIFMHILIYFFGVYGMYLLCKELKFSLMGIFVAIITYFYCFFHLYHQQHINMIFTTYLLPMLIYLTLNFFTKTKKHYILWSSLLISFTFYMGNFQSVLLICFAQAIFIMFYLLGNSKFSLGLMGFIKYFVFQYILVITIILPGVIISLQLFDISTRQIGSELYKQGSYSPIMLFNLIVPYFLGLDDKYLGSYINKDYLVHEIYVYAGVSAILTSVIALIFLKEKPLKWYYFVLTASFIILSINKYVPILNLYLLFPFNLFRYWIRAVVLLNFSMSLLLGAFFTQKNMKFKLSDYWYPLILIIIPIIVEILNINNHESFNVLRIIGLKSFSFDQRLNYWVILIISFFIFIALYILKIINFTRLKILLFLLITFDLLFFGNTIMRNAFIDKEMIYPKNTPYTFNSKERVFDLTGGIDGTDSLYYGYWGILGYDALIPTRVEKEIQHLNLKSSRYTEFADDIRAKDLIEKMDLAGIEKIITHEGVINTLTNYPVKNKETLVTELRREEGYFMFEVYTHQPTILKTFVANDSSWYVYANGRKMDKIKSNYVEFNLDKGLTVVEMKYYPTTFYKSLMISSVLLIFSLILYKKTKILE